MKKYIIFLILSLGFGFGSFSQFKKYGKKRQPQKMTPFIQALNNYGWYISPGATFTPKLNLINYDPTLSLSENGIQYKALNLSQKSKIGIYLEFGRYNLLSTKKLISYIDYGLAYKLLRSGQSYDLQRTGTGVNDTTTYSQRFTSHAISAHFNANNVLAINSNVFFQNTLGVNLDYSISQKIETEDNTPFVQAYQENPSKLMAQVHYKFGIGIKIGKLLYAIPSIEIPVLTGWKWEGGRATFGTFNSRYHPIIFSIRFAWLTEPDCPKVWDNNKETENGGGL